MKDFLGNELTPGDQVVWIVSSQSGGYYQKGFVVSPRGSMVNLEPYGNGYSYKTYRDQEKILKYEHTPGATFTPPVKEASKKKTPKDTPQVPTW